MNLSAAIVYEHSSLISCTGLISEWHITPYAEWDGTAWTGCGFGSYSSGCPIDFNVWKDLTPTPPLSQSNYYYYYYYTGGYGIPVTLVDSNPGQTGNSLLIYYRPVGYYRCIVHVEAGST